MVKATITSSFRFNQDKKKNRVFFCKETGKKYGREMRGMKKNVGRERETETGRRKERKRITGVSKLQTIQDMMR